MRGLLFLSGLLVLPVLVGAQSLTGIEAAALSYNEDAAPATITSAIQVTGVTQLTSAEVYVAGNYVPGEDVLSFAAAHGLTGSWDEPTGVLSIAVSPVAVPAPVADVEAALREVMYENINHGAY